MKPGHRQYRNCLRYPSTNKIIELNGWTDETGDNYGICNDGNRRLYLTVSNGVLVADIKDMQHE